MPDAVPVPVEQPVALVRVELSPGAAGDDRVVLPAPDHRVAQRRGNDVVTVAARRVNGGLQTEGFAGVVVDRVVPTVHGQRAQGQVRAQLRVDAQPGVERGAGPANTTPHAV